MNVRSIALPVEHGSWSFLAEPILLALLVAPSAAGVSIAVGTTAGFLVRQPGRMWWKNRSRMKASPRYSVAAWFTVGYSGLAVAGFAIAGLLEGIRPLVPFLAVAPVLLLFASYDARHEARRLAPELLAPLVIAVSAPSIALADGWSWSSAGALWALLGLRSVPTVLYIRARLRLGRGVREGIAVSAAAHVTAVVIGSALAAAALVPRLAVAALGILLVRAVAGLSRYRRPASTRAIGFSEVAWGALFVLLAAVGYRMMD